MRGQRPGRNLMKSSRHEVEEMVYPGRGRSALRVTCTNLDGLLSCKPVVRDYIRKNDQMCCA